MSQNYQFNTTPKTADRLKNLIDAAAGKEFRPDDIRGVESLNSLFGGESLGSQTEAMSYSQNLATVAAARGSLDHDSFVTRIKDAAADLKMYSGFESFSAQLTEGAVSRQQAATIELNAEANRQFDAAERMFPTIHIGYNEEMLELPIDIAGVGPYNIATNPAEQFDDLRPLASILSDTSFSGGDDMKMVPVFVDDTTHQNYKYFVDSSLWTPWDETYDQNDALGREPHKTNYLAPKKIGNIMALCTPPGAPKYEGNDEIDTGSMALQSLLFKIKTKDGEGVYALDTSSYAGNALRTNAHLNSKSARPLIVKSEGTLVTSFKDKDGKDASSLFASLGENVKVFLQWDVRLEYNRDTRSVSMTLSPEVTIHHIVDANGNRLIVDSSKVPDSTKALLDALELEATIEGVLLSLAHNNVNWSRYGQTITYANTLKQYNVRVQEPISVKYPMADRDVNNAVLAKCIRDMGLVISTRMTHDAFRAAERHFNYLVENNGLKVVPINDDSNDVLPGQHFFATTAAAETINLKKSTSTLDSKSALENVQAVLVNKIIDVITDIRVRSGFSAVKEIDGRDEEYVIVAHAALAPYLMTTGDVRTFGQNVKFSVVETNVDSEVGRFWIFPKSETKEGYIDAFGGLGICVSKELLFIEGDVRTPQRQFRMQIAQPAYLHHALGCIAGRVVVEDIQELLTEGGVLSAINRHLESTIVEQLPDSSDNGGSDGGNGNGGDGGNSGSDDGDEVEITPGG